MVTRLCQLPLDTPLQLRGMSVAAPDGDTPAAAAAAPPPHVARGLSIRISVEGAAEEVLTSRGCGSATRTNVPTVREKEERMEGVKQRRAREALDRAQVQGWGTHLTASVYSASCVQCECIVRWCYYIVSLGHYIVSRVRTTSGSSVIRFFFFSNVYLFFLCFL